MSSRSFRFKQFEIYHDKCAMKVGTDGVLIAAWATLNKNPHNILDIGCGSGLISLIAAQRCKNSHILGIDIDSNAIEQSKENANKTNWTSRINFMIGDINNINLDCYFDLIICNPPFFSETKDSPDIKRSQARHTYFMPFEVLVSKTYEWLNYDGEFCVILPTTEIYDFLNLAWIKGFYIKRKCAIITKKNAEPKRYMLEFSKKRCSYPETEYLSIYENNKDYNNLIYDIYK